MDYSIVPDSELLQKLDAGVIINDLEQHEGWQLINEACLRTARQAQRELLTVHASDMTKIIELQQIVKLYSAVIPSLLRHFRDESKIAFDELSERGANLTE